VARAIGTQPLVIRYSGVDPADWRRGAAAATGTMFTSGVVGGLACVGLGAIVGGVAGATFIALGIAMPALLVQDAWRFVFFAGGRDRDAVLTDLIWAIALVAFLLLVTNVAPGTPGAVLGWGASAIVGGLVGAWRAGVLPRPLATRAWLQEHSDLVGRYAAEVLVGLGASQATIYVVGVTAGLAQAGSLRAAQILLGPMHVVLQAAHLIAVPEGVRIRRRRPDRFRLAIGGLSVGLAGVILAWVVVLSLLPSSVGEALLGDSWASAQVVLIPLGLALVAQGISGGALVGLRVLADAKSSLRARIIDAAASFCLGVGGALMGGAIGAAWGIAIGEVVGALVFVAFFLQSESRHRQLALA
jgi:O-antigen/teichoic acid export membrane protein